METKMNKLVLKYVSSLVFLALAIAACEGSTETANTPAPPDYEISPLISECGGFVAAGNGAKIPQSDPATYCGAERLLWNYDATTKTLGLMNARITLNCCGDHSLQVAKDGETLVFTEVDAPQAATGGTRCKCNCVFDYAADISTVEGPMASLRIVRNITDADPATQTVWEGTLDLSAGEGEVIINTANADPWCTPPVP